MVHIAHAGVWPRLAQGKASTDPAIMDVAERIGHAPAQVVLRWHLQRGDVVFPKSMSVARMRENLDVFDCELASADVVPTGQDAALKAALGAEPDADGVQSSSRREPIGWRPGS